VKEDETSLEHKMIKRKLRQYAAFNNIASDSQPGARAAFSMHTRTFLENIFRSEGQQFIKTQMKT